MHAVAMPDILGAVDFEADKLACGIFAPPPERLGADIRVALVLWNGEADAGFKRIRLVAELVAREGEAGLDPQHVERLEPERREAIRRAGGHDRVPDLGRAVRWHHTS